MKIGIVGWGLEAKSVFNFYGPEHSYLIANEVKQDDFPAQSDTVQLRYLDIEKPVGISGQVADLNYLDGIENCDKVVFQPTAYFNLRQKFGDDADFWGKATTAYDIFYENQPTKNIIGVTGTKGKGTTSSLIAKFLEASGKKVHIGGNIGTPILDMLPDIQPDDWLVWELANFQLKAASHSPHIAVCVMIVPEHMDWHPTLEDYVEAKGNLFRYQKADDVAVFYPMSEYSAKIAGYSPGRKIPYYQPPGAFVRDDGMIVIDNYEVIHKSQVKLLGEHNLQNVCAALTAFWQVEQNPEAAHQVISTFSGLEHRLEFVREFNGVKYYDDSFGTTPETAIVALKAFDQPKVVILGGSDKGASYDELAAEIVKNNVRHALVIGQITDKVTAALSGAGFHEFTTGLTSMTDIVGKARAIAQPGDVVLLSAGAASFGLFKDYKDRGAQFKQAVLELP